MKWRIAFTVSGPAKFEAATKFAIDNGTDISQQIVGEESKPGKLGGKSIRETIVHILKGAGGRPLTAHEITSQLPAFGFSANSGSSTIHVMKKEGWLHHVKDGYKLRGVR